MVEERYYLWLFFSSSFLLSNTLSAFEGKYCYADGKRYEGEFKLGKFNG